MDLHINFKYLCKMNPRLSELYQKAIITGIRSRGVVDWHIWELFKQELNSIVGFEADQSSDELRTALAHTIAYQEIFEAFSARY